MPGPSIDPTERAHLRDPRGYTPPIVRYLPDSRVAGHVRRFWIPVWSLPAGEATVQRVLQYPVCLLVVSSDYARMVGPTTGLGRTELRGEGWAVGVMLQPATGSMLYDGPVGDLTDTFVELDRLSTLDGAGLARDVHDAMAADPLDEEGQRAAVLLLEDALARLPAPDEEGRLLNRIVEEVEGDPELRRVGQLCERFHLTERSLQRLTARRLGLSPKWLIQRRRLHEAAGLLRERASAYDLAAAAADLGDADQAHFTRDFRTVVGVTPGQFLAESDAPLTGG
jgi:AraC-like DNA-binding protein